ncbi:MAG: hypothetical protein ACYC0L_03015 [Thermoleophilia bacterium]
MAKTKSRLLHASAIVFGVGVVAGLGAFAYSVHHDAGRSPVTSDAASTLRTTTPPASVTGYLASAPDNSWVIFLDTAGGTIDAANYSGNGEVSVEHGTVSGDGKSVDFSGIHMSGLGSCPCRQLTDGSNIQILVPTNNGLETLTFYPSDVAAYNSSVSKLNAKAFKVNQDRQQAAAKTQADQQVHGQQVLAKEQATCAQVGGEWNPDTQRCVIRYTYAYNPYNVNFDENGNVVPSYGESSESCAAKSWRWHSDTDICEMVS